ncbi:hypothetical protein HK100_005244 [Physocladia obscura]|uniref:WW domain-containing protein n=1 Tax=Physocladia obscura TaxID=109957 RepID=A0AAD5X885_9FUNG|nr:hypothetical protein HK100_005244 [Physocladia obscura]
MHAGNVNGGWTRHYDERYGEYYYSHPTLGSTWDKPSEWQEGEGDGEGRDNRREDRRERERDRQRTLAQLDEKTRAPLNEAELIRLETPTNVNVDNLQPHQQYKQQQQQEQYHRPDPYQQQFAAITSPILAPPHFLTTDDSASNTNNNVSVADIYDYKKIPTINAGVSSAPSPLPHQLQPYQPQPYQPQFITPPAAPTPTNLNHLPFHPQQQFYYAPATNTSLLPLNQYQAPISVLDYSTTTQSLSQQQQLYPPSVPPPPPTIRDASPPPVIRTPNNNRINDSRNKYGSPAAFGGDVGAGAGGRVNGDGYDDDDDRRRGRGRRRSGADSGRREAKKGCNSEKKSKIYRSVKRVNWPRAPTITLSNIFVNPSASAAYSISGSVTDPTTASPLSVQINLATNVTVYSPNYESITASSITMSGMLLGTDNSTPINDTSVNGSVNEITFPGKGTMEFTMPATVIYSVTSATQLVADGVLDLFSARCMGTGGQVYLGWTVTVDIAAISWTGFKPSVSGKTAFACPNLSAVVSSLSAS